MAGDEVPPNDNEGPMLLAASWSFLSITLIIYAARMFSRLYPKFSLTAADYTITIAMACKTASVCFATRAIAHGFGRHSRYISRDDQRVVGMSLFATFLTGVPASCFARVSIACLLLRFTSNRTWRILIWAVMVLQVCVFMTYEIVQLTQCQSVISKKLQIHQTQCLTPTQVWSFTYVNISIAMFSDGVCAIAPALLIWRLSRSTLERVLVCFLMGTCLFATGCGVAKLYYMITYNFAARDFYEMINEFLWCRLEEAIIIMAACAPLLKSPIERIMKKLGLPTFENPTRDIETISAGVDESDKGEDSWS